MFTSKWVKLIKRSPRNCEKIYFSTFYQITEQREFKFLHCHDRKYIIKLLLIIREENSNSQPFIDKELEMLVITSIHTLKRGKKKCGREDVYNLVKESLDYNIYIENFSETLISLIDSSDVNIHANLVGKFLALKNRQGECWNSQDIALTTHSVSSYWSILA